MEKDRIDYIDYAKGIGILLMVIAHYEYLNHSLELWIYSFHMPLFFLLSGYLDYRYNLVTNTLVYIKKRIRSLLVPYCFFALLILALEFVIGKNRDIIHGVVSAFFYIKDPGFWFFFILFATDMFFLIYRKVRHRHIKMVLLLVLFILALRISWAGGGNVIYRTIPFQADFYPGCFFFFVIGALIAEYKNDFFITLQQNCKFLIAGLLLLSIFVYWYVSSNDIKIWVFIARPHFALITLIGILLIVTISLLLERKKNNQAIKAILQLLKFVATNAIVICIFHSKIFWLVRIIDSKLSIDPSSLQSHCLVLVGELLLLPPLIYLFNYYAPFLVGKKRYKLNKDRYVISK